MNNNSQFDPQDLNAALEALRSEDALQRNEGAEAAIRIGAPAVDGLLAMLQEPRVDRAQIMYTLAQIGDPKAASAFHSGLSDHDEAVRAHAAQGLVRIGDPAAAAAALRTINDSTDPLHLDITPSVLALSEMGLTVAPRLIDLLTNEDEMTRLHAQRALEFLLARRHGFRPGKGFPSGEAEAAMRAEWRANGDYNYTADPADRTRSAERWRQWLAGAKE